MSLPGHNSMTGLCGGLIAVVYHTPGTEQMFNKGMLSPLGPWMFRTTEEGPLQGEYNHTWSFLYNSKMVEIGRTK